MGTDCWVKQGAIDWRTAQLGLTRLSRSTPGSSGVDRMAAPPKANECFLNDIFRVGPRPHPLPRKKQQARCERGKTNFPIFMSRDILHDLFTVFYDQDAAKCGFCLRR